MAKEYELEIYGQPTLHARQNRKIKMCFCEPEGGAGESTNILLLIAGYGGNTDSKVYQKMRKQFADKYDLLTVQCDYLGSGFMLNNHHVPTTTSMLRRALTEEELKSLSEDVEANRKLLQGKHLPAKVELQENREDYNEMGIRQAMDQLMAIKVLADILEENGLAFAEKRLSIYGFSHGAYLAYLCNFLAPGLIDGLIDNSAYLMPHYLYVDRKVEIPGDTFILEKIYHYKVSDWKKQDWFDLESYDLSYLYRQFDNQADIIAYHGADDDMISLEEKAEFMRKIPGARLNVISASKIDGEIFQNTGHGLGADFLKLFDSAYGELQSGLAHRQTKASLQFCNRSFCTEKYAYEVNWDDGVPVLYQERLCQ